MLPRSRILRALAAALVLGTAVASGAGAGASGVTATANGCNSSPTYAGGGWLAFKPAGLNSITHQTSVTYAPDRMFATDGTGLSRTDDGGCVWTTLTLPDTPLVDESPLPVPLPVTTPAGSPYITGVSAPSTATSARFVYVSANLTVPRADTSGLPAPFNSTQDPATQPYVYVSADAGYHFHASHSGLPGLGSIGSIAASPSSPNIVYAVVTDAVTGKSGIYRSGDFGDTWTQMSSTLPAPDTLKVNPVVSTSVYALLGDGLEVSNDSGGTFARVSHTRSTAVYDVNPGSGYVQLVQGFSDAATWERSTNGGNSFSPQFSPEPLSGIATSALVNAVVLVGKSDWLQMHKLGSLDPGAYEQAPVTPSAGTLSQVQMAAPVGLRLSVSSLLAPTNGGNTLVSRLLFNIATGKGEIHLVPVQLQPHGVAKQFPSTLFPFNQTVALGPGQHRDVDYHLLLPRTPTPVDLMFLVDTTNSTDETLNGVRQGLAKIADQLAALGLDVQFGVAEFRDYTPDDYGYGDPGDYPYLLRRKVGPYNAGLQAAINALHSEGGGDPDEAALTALYQSTLGTGQRVFNVNNHWDQVVAPGLEAGYRPNSLRLAVVASDAAYHKEPEYPTPSWASTVAALVSHSVHQMGLAVESGKVDGTNIPRFDSLKDMKRMAVSTGALAPAGGVDCDGDGKVDVPQGQPLICKILHPPTQTDPTGNLIQTGPAPALPLANPIADVAATIPDLSSVGLQVSGAPAPVASVISVPRAPVVNLHTDNTLDFTVRYTCPAARTAHSYAVGLHAVAGVRPLTSAATTLDCKPVAPPPVPPVVPLLGGVAAVAAAPVTPPNPPVQGTGNANPNPAVNANAGFAQQEDQERQLAFADADQGVELAPDDNTMAMSRRRTSDPSSMFVAGAAGLMMAGAAGVVARRRRTALQCARVGTWR